MKQTTASNTMSLRGNMNLSEYLRCKRIDKTSNQSPTNTRIGDKDNGIYGGSYYINDEDYPEFLEIYKRDVINKKNSNEYLTEKQLLEDGPLVYDLDFHYDYLVEERQHSEEHIEDGLVIIFEELKKVFNFDSSTKVDVFIFEKPDVNRVKEKKITKDGIHVMIGLKVNRAVQKYLRKILIKKVGEETWGELPIINTDGWKGVFDEGITNGTVNWQLYGSKKPSNKKYGLTYWYTMSYDESDGEISLEKENVKDFLADIDLMKVSVRNSNNPSFPMKSSFVPEYEKLLSTSNRINAMKNAPSITRKTVYNSFSLNDIRKISNQEELDEQYDIFYESLGNSEYEKKDLCEYTLNLPPSYYENGSYDKWIRVGWALKNTDSRFLILWIKFSSKSSSFDYQCISLLVDKWEEFDEGNREGLTKRSIIYWIKTDAPEQFEAIKAKSISALIDETIRSSMQSGDGSRNGGCTDYDLAQVLYALKKGEFVCDSVKNNTWHQFKNHRWVLNDSGTSLRNTISKEMRNLYKEKGASYTMAGNSNTREEVAYQDTHDNEVKSDVKECEADKALAQNCMLVYGRLGRTSDKKNIMTEAKELFYDHGELLKNLDSNPYLLCFRNGVYDFKEDCFRNGRPEDCISKCTNINYIPLKEEHKPVMEEINNFLHELFPIPDLYEYMWDHLASILLGTSVGLNQTFTMYTGEGRNGKSVMISLMEKVLGDYKKDVNLTLITDKRGKIGGATPEVLSLQGVRYAVMQEPQKGDVVNEGILKQLTSGKDPIQSRGLYSPDVISFLPQFTLAVACNVMMEVNSNDYGTWRRIHVSPFVSLFTEKPVKNDPDKPYQFKVDRELDNKFDDWKEVFASMLIERARKTKGYVRSCDIVLEASNKYRESQDVFTQFVGDKIIKDPTGKITKTDLLQEYTIWFSNNHQGKQSSQRELYETMEKRFGKLEKNKKYWTGWSISYDNGDDDDDDADAIDEDDLA